VKKQLQHISVFLLLCVFLVTCKEADTIVPVSAIAINGGDITIAKDGDTKELFVTITPSNATEQRVTWTSSDENVATVDQKGLLTARTAGTTTVTARAIDGSGKTASVKVTVENLPPAVMTPQDIFAELKGKRVITNGWADLYNGQGLSYTNPSSLTLINDKTHPNAISKREAFTTAINSNMAKFIIISGDIDLSDGKISDNDKSYFDQFEGTSPYKRINGDISFPVGSNTTIIGIDDARIMFGGLSIQDRENIIIRNITFWDAHGSTEQDTQQVPDSKASATALQVGTSSNGHGVRGLWVDHCKFTDGTCSDLIRNVNHDGAFDIRHGTFITVSWTEFTNHDKVMLVGSGDSAPYLDPLLRQITLHHNYFHGVTQRMPRTRGAQVHIYNNCYNNIGTQGNNGTFMGPGVNAQFIVENNFFGTKSGGTNSKQIDWMDNGTNPAQVYYAGNNKQDLAFWVKASAAKPWTITYEYTLEPNAELLQSIPAKAGTTLRFD
jgi:pectate lyase